MHTLLAFGVLHFTFESAHGGLNTFDEATDRVDRLRDAMLSDCKYPLFISWDSGFPGNYSDHLFLNRRGKQAKFLGPLSSPFVFIEYSLRAVSRFPAYTYHVIFHQNKYLKSKVLPTLEINNSQSINDDNQFNINRPKNNGNPNFSDLATIWNPIKLLTSPFVDSLGSGAWNSMLRRADLVLNKYDAIEFKTSSPTAVSKFLNEWKKSHQEREILLIGHRMGTIIANTIIAKHHDLSFSQIVYMAAACTINDLKKVVVPYLIHHKKTSFYNVSLHPTRDILENSSLVDITPRGSLLVWIDNTIGTINSFQDRTAGFWDNIYAAKNETFPDEIRSNIYLTHFGINDGSPQNHGDFDDYPFWRNSFWHGSSVPD